MTTNTPNYSPIARVLKDLPFRLPAHRMLRHLMQVCRFISAYSILICSLVSGGFLHASEFQVSGIIERTLDENARIRSVLAEKRKARKHNNEVSIFTESSYRFEVSVRDCRWQIVLAPIDHAGVARPTIVRAGSDGENTYVILTPTDALQSIAQPKPLLATSIAQILSGPIPLELPAVPIIWLSYCSSCYFHTVKSDKIIPINLGLPPTASSPKYFLRRATWKSLSDTLLIPANVTYFEDEIVRVQPGGQVKLLRLDPPFDKGYKMASYEVVSITNHLNCELPSEFRFQAFVPNYPRAESAADVKIIEQWEGRMTQLNSVVALQDGEFIPSLPGKVPIADRRFVNESVPLVGYVTNSWPSRKTVRDSQTFDMWRSAATTIGRKPTNTYTGNKALRLVLFAFISGGIALFLWLFLTKNERKVERKQ